MMVPSSPPNMIHSARLLTPPPCSKNSFWWKYL